MTCLCQFILGYVYFYDQSVWLSWVNCAITDCRSVSFFLTLTCFLTPFNKSGTSARQEFATQFIRRPVVHTRKCQTIVRRNLFECKQLSYERHISSHFKWHRPPQTKKQKETKTPNLPAPQYDFHVSVRVRLSWLFFIEEITLSHSRWVHVSIFFSYIDAIEVLLCRFFSSIICFVWAPMRHACWLWPERAHVLSFTEKIITILNRRSRFRALIFILSGGTKWDISCTRFLWIGSTCRAFY